MLFLRRAKHKKQHPRAWLYSAVFAGRFSFYLVLLLCGSILIQPVNQAFAQAPEEEAAPAPVAEDVAPQQEEVPEETTLPEPEVPAEPPAENTSETPVNTEAPAEGQEVPAEEPPVESGVDGSGDAGEPSGDIPDEELEDNEIVIAEQETKRVRTKDGEILKIESLVTEQNYYQFTKESCIETGDGVFHCTTRQDDVSNVDSVVYAERDQTEGDMEIFLKTSRGKIKQLTDNQLDDTMPHYDPGAMKVVWQRLKDGRHQIMIYDILEEEEIQLTFSKTNNMEPKVSDAGIVWQAWDENDWEIMLFDGNYTEQITDNDIQDVAPVVQDGYILWNVLGGKEQQARVYSLDTKEIVTIEGHEGGSIINPRFVLVYDTEYSNGDVVTQTFDPSTGLSEPVAATPAPLPVDIPNTDPTGEIRALIQGKAQKDEKEYKDLSTTSSGDNASSTAHDAGTLTLNASSTDGTDAPATIGETGDFVLTEYDLVIPEHSLDEALADEPDLIIENTQ